MEHAKNGKLIEEISKARARLRAEIMEQESKLHNLKNQLHELTFIQEKLEGAESELR